MSSIRELRLVANLRPNLDDREAIQESFQEIITDLAAIKDQWNTALYPVIGSLPQGRRAVARASRNLFIDPEVNGLDGSQLYMDMTSRIQELGGLLHNGDRPKTIKEVVMEVYQTTLARVNLVEQLLNDVNVANPAYDDTEVRAWIRQLAGNTWDIDEDANGDPFNAANFTGSPNKSIATSIWQRLLNTRHLIGIEGEALTEQNLATGALLGGTNYLAANTSVIDALITLDAQVFAGGGAVTLQDVYDNSGAGAEVIAMGSAVRPIQLQAFSADTDEILELQGAVKWRAYNTTLGAWADSVVSRATVVENAANDLNHEVRAYYPDPAANNDEILRFGVNKGAAVTTETALLTLGRTSLTADHQNFTMELGREPIADGGEPHLTMRSYNAGGGWTSRIETPLGMLFTTGDQFLMTGPNIGFNSAGPITSAAAGDNYISSGGKVDVQAGGEVDIDAAGDVTIDTTVGNIQIHNSETTALSGSVGITADGTDIFSFFQTTGTDATLLLSTNDTGSSIVIDSEVDAYVKALEKVHLVSYGSGWQFLGNNGAWTNGIVFSHADPILKVTGAGTMSYSYAFGDGTIGSIVYKENEFADSNYQAPATAAVDGLLITAAAFKPSGHAPNTSFGGTTDPYRVYRDNVVKFKSMLEIDVSKVGALGTNEIASHFNLASATWTNANGIVTIAFDGSLDHSNYTVTCSYDSTQDMTFKVQNQTVNGFDIRCRFLNAGAYQDVTNADADFDLHIQVV